MEICILENEQEVSKAAAEIFIDAIRKNPKIVLGLATGSTPLGLYAELAKACDKGLDFSEVTSFNLDEYVGLSKDNPQSYRYFMNENLFSKINIKKEATHFPFADREEDFVPGAYEKEIAKAGGIDLQLLGIGRNGHIAFNEPDETLSVDTSLVKLTESTIEANARFFDDPEEVPKTAVTSGMGTILNAKRVVLLATGKAKQEAVLELVTGKRVRTTFPAGFLRCHPDAILLCDKESAVLLEEC